jgi:hypothetical protein
MSIVLGDIAEGGDQLGGEQDGILGGRKMGDARSAAGCRWCVAFFSSL